MCTCIVCICHLPSVVVLCVQSSRMTKLEAEKTEGQGAATSQQRYNEITSLLEQIKVRQAKCMHIHNIHVYMIIENTCRYQV